MTVMNIGSTGGNPNIMRVMSKLDPEKKGYVAGLTSPFGPNKGGLMSAPKDGYGVYYKCTEAIVLANPRTACELLPSITTQY